MLLTRFIDGRPRACDDRARVTTPLPPAPSPGESDDFRALIDSVGAIVWEAVPGDVPGQATFTFVSEGTEAVLGYPAARWLRDPGFWFEITHPGDRERVNATIAGVARTGEDADFEYRVLAADGREVWVRNIVRANGTRPRLRGVVVDVSGRRAAEERLQRLQLLTGALSELLTAREIAAIVASQGRAAVGASAVAVFLRTDDGGLEIAGYDGYDLADIEPFCRVPLTERLPASKVVLSGVPLFLSGAEMDERFPNLTGRRLAGTGQFVALPLRAGDRVAGSLALRMPGDRPLEDADRVVLDVLSRACSQALVRAEYVAAERAARRSAEDANALLDTLIRTAPDGFALFDREFRYVRVNDALARINGLPVEEHLGKTTAEVIPGVPEEGALAPLRQVLETGEPVVDLEVTGETAGAPGRQSTWLVSYYPVRDADGEIGWMGAFVVDITERKRAEERAVVLGELGTAFDEVIGVEARLERLVETCVPRVASTATVLLLDDDDNLERVALCDIDHEAERLLARLPPPAAGPLLAGTQRVPDIGPAWYEQSGTPPASREIYERIGNRSGLYVPMRVRDRTIGVLVLGSRRPDDFDEGGVRFAEELARRTALAVDNARLLESERLARERTARLHSVAAALAEALTPSDVAAAILAEVVPALGADRGSVFQLAEDDAALEAIAWRNVDSALIEPYTRIGLRERVPVADAVRQRRALWFEKPEEFEEAYPDFARLILGGGYRASASIPLSVGSRINGAMNLSFTRPHTFSTEDRELLVALSAQCAQALERARLFEQERRVAATLQRSLLPARLPRIDGLQIAVRYLPAAGLEAGGDFYEALPLADGTVGIAVGDVVGRGASAAAAMGQLRSALRAFALTGVPPGEVLKRLSGFASTVDGAMAATAVFATLHPGHGELRYACAGHPWPLVVGPDGEAEYLKGGRSVPLGCVADAEFVEDTVRLAPGATLLLFTDGLTERRGQDMMAVYERLRSVLAERHEAELEAILDEVVDEVGADAPLDDVALVAVRRTRHELPGVHLRFPATPEQVPVARREVRAWLDSISAPPEAADDVLLACGEAVANAVEHAYRNQPPGEVEIELSQPEPGVVAIAVRDQGVWKEPVASLHRGRGFGLMRMLMQDVHLDQSPEGTVVRMRRRIAMTAPMREILPAAQPGAGGAECTVTIAYGVAKLQGSLDLSSVARVAPELRKLVAEGAEMTIDLTDVDYLDSAGARLLLTTSESLPGMVIVVAPRGTAPRRALELSGLMELLDLRP
jgi:anti-anti-sigma factor